jgi:1,4-alpha-glucan branching enzyme
MSPSSRLIKQADTVLHLVGEGRHEERYAKLGAHVIEHQGVRGTAFAVWAPSARSVCGRRDSCAAS